MPRRIDTPEQPIRIELRCREFDFAHAPDLTGTGAVYVALVTVTGDYDDAAFREVGRDPIASRAAKIAARANEARGHRDLGAWVMCDHGDGPRPPGAMRGPVRVSYRVRGGVKCRTQQHRGGTISYVPIPSGPGGSLTPGEQRGAAEQRAAYAAKRP